MTRMWQQPKTLAPPLDWVSLSSTFIYLLVLRSILSSTTTYHTSPQSQSRPFCGRHFLLGARFIRSQDWRSSYDASIRWMREGDIGNLEAGKNTQIVCLGEEEGKLELAERCLRHTLNSSWMWKIWIWATPVQWTRYHSRINVILAISLARQ